MARKRYGEDDILRLIREVEVHCNSGMDVVSACRAAGVSDKTYYGWSRTWQSSHPTFFDDPTARIGTSGMCPRSCVR